MRAHATPKKKRVRKLPHTHKSTHAAGKGPLHQVVEAGLARRELLDEVRRALRRHVHENAGDILQVLLDLGTLKQKLTS